MASSRPLALTLIPALLTYSSFIHPSSLRPRCPPLRWISWSGGRRRACCWGEALLIPFRRLAPRRHGGHVLTRRWSTAGLNRLFRAPVARRAVLVFQPGKRGFSEADWQARRRVLVRCGPSPTHQRHRGKPWRIRVIARTQWPAGPGGAKAAQASRGFWCGGGRLPGGRDRTKGDGLRPSRRAMSCSKAFRSHTAPGPPSGSLHRPVSARKAPCQLCAAAIGIRPCAGQPDGPHRSRSVWTSAPP